MSRTCVVGKRLNCLTVLSEGARISGGRIRTTLNCVCDCGKEVTVFKGGNTKSCGCIKRVYKDQYKSKKIRSSWRAMKERCLNPKNDNYKNYGAKGILICERWMDFMNFYNDTSDTWQDGLTIDRFPNNKGNYEPGNFRWATMQEQQQNKTNTKLTTQIIIEIRQSKLMAKDICKIYDVHEETIRKIRKNIRWQNV